MLLNDEGDFLLCTDDEGWMLRRRITIDSLSVPKHMIMVSVDFLCHAMRSDCTDLRQCEQCTRVLEVRAFVVTRSAADASWSATTRK